MTIEMSYVLFVVLFIYKYKKQQKRPARIICVFSTHTILVPLDIPTKFDAEIFEEPISCCSNLARTAAAPGHAKLGRNRGHALNAVAIGLPGENAKSPDSYDCNQTGSSSHATDGRYQLTTKID